MLTLDGDVFLIILSPEVLVDSAVKEPVWLLVV